MQSYNLFLWLIFFNCPSESSFNNNFDINEDEVYDMDLSDEIYQELTMEDDEDDYVFDTVFKNLTAFRWPNGIIPYEFNDTASDFDELYLRKIFDAMSFLNTKLDGCIYIR